MTSEAGSTKTTLGVDSIFDSIGDLIADIDDFEGDVVDLSELLGSLHPVPNLVIDPPPQKEEQSEGPLALATNQSDPGDAVDLQEVLTVIANESNAVLLDTNGSWTEIPIDII